MVRRETVEAEKPRRCVAIFLWGCIAEKADGFFGAPGGLVEFGGHALFHKGGTARWLLVVLVPSRAFFDFEPAGVVIVVSPVGLRMVRPVKILVAVTVFDACLDLAVGTRSEVELSGEPATIAGVGEHFGQKNFIGGHLLAILSTAGGARITSGQKAGAARRAHRALAVGMAEADAVGRELIEVRSVDQRIAVGGDGIEALLICTEPEDVGARRHGGIAGSSASKARFSVYDQAFSRIASAL